jgi:YfiH family protein
VRRVAGPTNAPAEHDGLVSTERGVAPMVLVADCLPIVVAGGGGVAVLHGGWRGLAGGIVARGVAELRTAVGTDVRLEAVIGPGAGPCCYEVSEDVHAAFAALGPGLRHGRNLDLGRAAARQLEAVGVAAIELCGICTICDPRFFSHRRDRGVTGRQAGIAWLS